MSKALSTQVAPIAASSAATSVWLRRTGIVLGASALVAVGAHLSLPLYFTPVPLSMAPFSVLLLGLLLSPRMAAASLGAYLAEGALGLPVFAPSPLYGLAHLLGPTGGYLVAYPIAAVLISLLRRPSERSFWAGLACAACGNLTILVGGALWLAVVTHATAQAVFATAILPFLPGDALKVAAAAGLAVGFNRLRRQSS